MENKKSDSAKRASEERKSETFDFNKSKIDGRRF